MGKGFRRDLGLPSQVKSCPGWTEAAPEVVSSPAHQMLSCFEGSGMTACNQLCFTPAGDGGGPA